MLDTRYPVRYTTHRSPTVSFIESTLPVDQLLFDPNNYRYQDTTDFVYADQSRFHEESVQERAYKTLRASASVEQLKASILRNGFIPIEKLVVKEYPQKIGKYLVLEGNRRLAALRWIDQDEKAGVVLSPEIKAALLAVPVVIVDGDEELTYKAMMGIRHVSGINQWGGYQRAKLVTELRTEFDLDSAEVAERLGMTAHEVNRRFRAFRALSQMKENEEYGEFSNPDMYPIFHEAVSIPAVRDWLKWDDASSTFTNGEELLRFYSLLVPTETDDSQTKDPKILTKDQVRELRSILENTEAKTLLFAPDKSFIDALSVAKREEAAKSWISSVASAIGALQGLGVFELIELTEEQKKEIEKLRDLTVDILTSYEKLKK
jgi:hypothetical protein